MTRNAIPVNHRSPFVRYQTTNATIAAGISMKSKRMTKIIIRPIMIKPIRPKRSKPRKLKDDPSALHKLKR